MILPNRDGKGDFQALGELSKTFSCPTRYCTLTFHQTNMQFGGASIPMCITVSKPIAENSLAREGYFIALYRMTSDVVA